MVTPHAQYHEVITVSLRNCIFSLILLIFFISFIFNTIESSRQVKLRHSGFGFSRHRIPEQKPHRVLIQHLRQRDQFKIIGKNIRIRRSLMGFSQSALAGRLGITFQQVQKYEKGTNSFSPAKLLQCSKIFRCGVEEVFHDPTLLGGNTPMPVPSRRSLHLVQSFERLGSAEVQKRIGDFVHALAKSDPENS